MIVNDALDTHLTEAETALRSLVKAARKITAHSGRWPTHLGDCIGVLSLPECSCGVADLLFASRRVDAAILAACQVEPAAEAPDHHEAVADALAERGMA